MNNFIHLLVENVSFSWNYHFKILVHVMKKLFVLHNISKDPFGEKRGCFNYESIEKRLDEIKRRLDEKQVPSSDDSSEESEMETNEKTGDITQDTESDTAGVTDVKGGENVKAIS